MNALKRKRKMKRLVRRFIRASIIIIPILLLIGIAAFFIQRQQKDNEKDSQEVVLPSEKEESTPEPEPEPEPIRASILSAGDIIMHDPLLTSNYYKKADGSFENILVENEREMVENLMEAIDCFEKTFQFPCLGLKINKEHIFELIFKDPDDEFELAFCSFKTENIDKLRAFFRHDISLEERY